jgi:alanyl-tRNA synthetase
MNATLLKEKYLAFFTSKGHAIIPSSSLVPEHDPTVLFTTAGMHPLVPFLLGQPHPLGKRLVNVQKCVRTGDIDAVGDATHLTFFEMLGNWSLGDYFKQEAISWSWEFLTSPSWLAITPNNLAVTCFAGDSDAPKDSQAAEIWLKLGVPKERIAFLPKADNWWGPAGTTGPCGPDTEIFYWKNQSRPAPKQFDPSDKNWVEIWNNVFMQYDKQANGTLAPLAKPCVDTGMGVERTACVLQGKESVYDTEIFTPLFDELERLCGKEYGEAENSFRIIADHMRSATFLLGDERAVVPGNVDQGYVLRRLLRRAMRHAHTLGIKDGMCTSLAKVVIGLFGSQYPLLVHKQATILDELQKEEAKFSLTLEKGLKEFEKMVGALATSHHPILSGKDAFLLFSSYGFPLEMTIELAKERKLAVQTNGFEKEFEKHKELSRVGAEQKFKGGLADTNTKTVKLHTATHLLNEALRKILDPSIAQKGSNITEERLRFDFNFPRKLTPQEVQALEDEVNRVINQQLPISKEEMTPLEATQRGAQSEFGARYPDKVSVYSMGTYSKEICMGPHVENTRELGTFKILKEEAVASGIRRIKATVQ